MTNRLKYIPNFLARCLTPDSANAQQASNRPAVPPRRINHHALAANRAPARTCADLPTAPIRAAVQEHDPYSFSLSASSLDPAEIAIPIAPRLQTKLARLEASLTAASLAETDVVPPVFYGYVAALTLKSNRAPDAALSALDVAHLPQFAALENRRLPGLNLSIYKHQSDFIAALMHPLPSGGLRAIFPLLNAITGAVGHHHVMADARPGPAGQPPSVVLLESVQAAYQLESHSLLYAQMRQLGLDLQRVGLIEIAAQQANHGCAMYSLHFAIKSHKNAALLTGLHNNLRQHGRLSPDLDVATLYAHSPLNAAAKAGKTTQGIARAVFNSQVVSFAPASLVLPQDFFKHTGSAGQARQLGTQPLQQIRIERGLDKGPDPRVNSANHPQPETLAARVQAFQVQR